MALQLLQSLERAPAVQDSIAVLNLSKTRTSVRGMDLNRDIKPPNALLTPSLSTSSTSVKDDDNICLYTYIPQVEKHFNLEGKIGEGTFSHVYKARLKMGNTSTEFAIKFLIPTSHPSRIANELKCLRDIGGTSNVMDVKMCFLHKGHVAIVMPFFPHEKFSDYVCKLSILEVQEYLRHLLIALKRVHSFNIIHRDIKPSNFLYSRKLKRFSLVDFGLAQRLDEINGEKVSTEETVWPKVTTDLNRKRSRTLDQENQRSQLKRQCLPAVHLSQPLHASNVHNVAQGEAINTKLPQFPVAAVKTAVKGPSLSQANRPTTQGRRGKTKLCCCFGRNEVCNICLSRY